jgi:hypothetical protein
VISLIEEKYSSDLLSWLGFYIGFSDEEEYRNIGERIRKEYGPQSTPNTSVDDEQELLHILLT